MVCLFEPSADQVSSSINNLFFKMCTQSNMQNLLWVQTHGVASFLRPPLTWILDYINKELYFSPITHYVRGLIFQQAVFFLLHKISVSERWNTLAHTPIGLHERKKFSWNWERSICISLGFGQRLSLTFAQRAPLMLKRNFQYNDPSMKGILMRA